VAQGSAQNDFSLAEYPLAISALLVAMVSKLCSIVTILLGLLAHVLAKPDAGTCASQGVEAGCEALNDEDSAMLQITSAKESWTYLAGYNCYPGNGAVTQSAQERVSGYPECKAKFSDWDGVVMDQMQTTCFGIKGITESECVTGSPYGTYVTPSGAPAPTPQDFCGKACTFATEQSDCGGTCGYCDGMMCSQGTPPTPVPPTDFCGRACTFATEQRDCGGKCGYCDGMMCSQGTPLSPAPTPGPPSSDWTLHAGYNCYYPDHGAAGQSGPDSVSGMPECQAKYSSWSGIVMDRAQTTCWGISGITLSQCVTGSAYDTYTAQ